MELGITLTSECLHSPSATINADCAVDHARHQNIAANENDTNDVEYMKFQVRCLLIGRNLASSGRVDKG